MVVEVTCPKCDIELEVEIWIPGFCECGNHYTWNEFCLEDYSDCWAEIEWEDWGV